MTASCSMQGVVPVKMGICEIVECLMNDHPDERPP